MVKAKNSISKGTRSQSDRRGPTLAETGAMISVIAAAVGFGVTLAQAWLDWRRNKLGDWSDYVQSLIMSVSPWIVALVLLVKLNRFREGRRNTHFQISRR